MAIDFTKNNTHIVGFPSKVASAMGQYGHVINLEMVADADNFTLATKGDYVSFDRYEAGAVTANAVEGRINEQAAEKANGNEPCWYVEFTKLPADQVFIVYNSPVSPYSESELRDEGLFYNAEGDVTQGMEVHLGDVISLSKAAFTGTPVAGKAVKYAAGKYVVQ